MASIDPTQPIPLYYQLKTSSSKRSQRALRLDNRLPTEHESGQYAISRTPVTRALSELAEEGVILRTATRHVRQSPLAPATRQPEAVVVPRTVACISAMPP
jgi:multiple sugar transport system substrate-binding protein